MFISLMQSHFDEVDVSSLFDKSFLMDNFERSKGALLKTRYGYKYKIQSGRIFAFIVKTKCLIEWDESARVPSAIATDASL